MQRRQLRDASGAVVELPVRPSRIVSLVPSVTETLFALGLGDRLVGVTDWCVHPVEGVTRLPKVRGTKNPDHAAIDRLTPDLVIANLEENREIDVRRMRQRGLRVWVDYPRTVDDAMRQIGWLAELGAAPEVTRAVLRPIERALAVARSDQIQRAAPPQRGFIAVWKDPWMTVSRDTYAHDLLALAGIDNLFADANERYPRVTLEEVAAREPEIVILPDEPYNFSLQDVEDLSSHGTPLGPTPAALHRHIHLIDGTLAFWHGPRIGRAIEELRALARHGPGTKDR